MTEILTVNLITKDNKVYATSRDIAKKLGKRHEKICDKIKEVLTIPEFVEREFKTSQGNTYKEYLLDKDAFTLLLFNFTGYNDFKRAYIKRFNEMENLLKQKEFIKQKFISIQDALESQIKYLDKIDGHQNLYDFMESIDSNEIKDLTKKLISKFNHKVVNNVEENMLAKPDRRKLICSSKKLTNKFIKINTIIELSLN